VTVAQDATQCSVKQISVALASNNFTLSKVGLLLQDPGQTGNRATQRPSNVSLKIKASFDSSESYTFYCRTQHLYGAYKASL